MMLRRFFPFVFLLATTRLVSGQNYLNSTRFAESPVPPAPAYQQPGNWAALPQTNDEADKTPEGCRPAPPDAPVDVFYVHPTLYSDAPKTEFRWNQDVRDPELNRQVDESPMRYQASAFNAAGRVYAPRYRQAHYSAFLTPHLDDKQQALNIAYADVEAAFDYFIQNYNQGRPFVLAGHSQGTIHAARLLKYRIVGTPLQKNLVAAYLPGIAISADSLAGLPVCTDSVSTGCFVSWRTYRWGYIPPRSALAGDGAVCVNPISWEYPAGGVTDSVRGYIGRSHHMGAVIRPFGRIYRRRCDAGLYRDVLWVHRPRFPGSVLIRTTNYHIGDINLFYMDIRHNAALRVHHFLNDRRPGP